MNFMDISLKHWNVHIPHLYYKELDGSVHAKQVN